MRFITTASLALLCASTFAASAVEEGGFPSYAGLRGSLAFQSGASGHANTTPPINTKVNGNVGGGGSVFWGIDLPAGFDAELELLYRYTTLKDASINGTAFKVGGYTQSFAPMVNVYWTAPVDLPVKPYIGAGLGYAWNEAGINSSVRPAFRPSTATSGGWPTTRWLGSPSRRAIAPGSRSATAGCIKIRGSTAEPASLALPRGTATASTLDI
jgi:opacity protein-like surface antigen